MKRVLVVFSGLMLAALAAPAFALDAAAADKLVRKSKCLTCHHKTKKKDGPPFTETAKKYKGKPEAMEKLSKHVTVPSTVEIDGEEEEHETLRSKDPADVKNVVEWILSL